MENQNKTRKVSKFGSRRQVFNGTAMMTTGGLRKEHLTKNPRGRIVSTKRHNLAKERKFGGKMESEEQKEEDTNNQNDQ